MSEYALTPQEIEGKIGAPTYAVWRALEEWLAENYIMDITWGKGGKRWERELKYRKGGKTLCCFYPAEGFFGFMLIFGKEERGRVEALRPELSDAAWNFYAAATTYHDGKWVMLEFFDDTLLEDAKKLLLCKRKPNRKK